MDGDGGVTVSGELRQWHALTLSLAGPFARERDTAPNPFLDFRLTATFEHESGAPRYRVPGYFAADGRSAETGADAGTVWRAHLSPDEPGRWRYRVSFVRGPAIAVSGEAGEPLAPFDGATGSFEVAPTDKTGRDFRGKGPLQYVGGHHLRFAGSGDYFLKAGPDSPETFLASVDFDGTVARKPDVPLKTWEPHVRDWRAGDPTWRGGRGRGLIGALNYLASEGVNSFSFLPYNAGGDGDNVWPFVDRDDKLHYDCSKLDQWGIVFAHAQRLGLHLHFKLQETENDDQRQGRERTPASVPTALDGGALGPERKLYLRELVARFGHHLALNWNLGEENTQTPDEQRAMARFIADTDPYDHHRVVHTYPDEQERVYEPLLGSGSALTGASLQNAWNATHARTHQWVTASARAGRPWVVANDEQGPASFGAPPDPGYQGFGGVADEEGKPYDLHDVRRYTLWGNLMAGGAGVEYYFGYRLPQNDLVAEDFRSRERTWRYSRIALELFEREAIPFWAMRNADELVGNPARDNSRYCLALPGELYLVYLPRGGEATLDLSGAAGTFDVSWHDPRTGGPPVPAAAVRGGAPAALRAPTASDDWLAVVRSRPLGSPAGRPTAQTTREGETPRWGGHVLRREASWYSSPEARAVADSVLQYQARHGAWPKNTNLAVPPRSADDIPGDGRENTIDNGATTLPIRFLAMVAHATGEARYREAVVRGVDYLLEAQYPNGGWPQFYPLRDGYYSHVTFNDGAMVNVLSLLREVAAGAPPYAFLDARRRGQAAAAVARGIECILRTQIRQDGELTVWCAQYDERTLEPAWARAYEPPSLSGGESVGIVRFLMGLEDPSPRVVATIEGAVAWFKKVAIPGLRSERFVDSEGREDRRVVLDPNAGPLWARFYELETNRPIFLGRDSVVRYSLSEIEQERRGGYAYYGTWPAELLEEDYPRWRARQRAGSGAGAGTPTWSRGIEGQRKADLGNGSYLNPIVSGDHPDPSILKDGDNYYMTFSSFDAYPGLVIWHSRDLVNWRPIGPALFENVGSVWAPDLVKHGGRYFIYFPGIGPYRSTYVIWADDIRGPWSAPIDLKNPRIDPGHAVGPDGRRYLFLSAGYLVPLSDDGLSIVGPEKKIYDGWRYPEDWIVETFAQEGPKILRKGGYYYQVLAEGGTAGPPTGHMVIAARSRTIEGPWENSPYNPIVRTRSPSERWWSKGHATLVEGPDERWWMVYHAYENGFYNLGRQALLQPIEWLEDGWFRATHDPDRPIPKPVPDSKGEHGFAFSDDFSTDKMGVQWSFYRGTEADRSRYRHEDRSLVLRAKGTSPADSSPLWFVTGDHAYEFQVEVDADPGAVAGVLLFYNQRMYVGLGLSDESLIVHNYGMERRAARPAHVGRRLHFRLRNDRHIVTIHYSVDGETWERFDRAMEVSGYHHNVGYDFLSLRPALYAAGSGEVRFRSFQYRALP